MDGSKAFITLYGAAGAAVDELYKVRTVTPELTKAIEILKEAIAKVEEMDEE